MDSWLASLEELRACIDNEEFQNGVNICNQIVEKDDVPSIVRVLTLECLATCLLHLQQYQKVVDLSSKGHDKDSNLPLLQAYALYRLERYHQAKVLLEKSNYIESDFGKLLMAQVQYHLHETKEVLQLYDSLLQNDKTQEEVRAELVTNALATLLADATPQVRDHPLAHDTTIQLAMDTLQDEDYDGWYNLATWLHVTGTPSETMLERARQACINALAQVDDLSPADRTNELGPMEVNLSWASQWNGQTAINAISTNTVAADLLPASVKTVRAMNEALALGGDHQRALKVLLAVQTELPSWPLLHQRLWWYNCAVLQLRVNNVENCRKTCKSLHGTLRKKGKDAGEAVEDSTSRWWWQSRLDALEALCFSKEGKKQKAEDLLKESLTKLRAVANGSNSDTLDHAVAHIQLHLFQLQHGDTTEATNAKDKIQLLESLPSSIRSQRAVVATLVSLHQSQGNLTEASKLLQNDELAFGDFCIAQGNYEQAIDFIQERIAESDNSKNTDQNDKQCILQAKLVEVLSYVDPARAKQALSQLSSQLQQVVENQDDWNGEELEEREVPRSLTKAAWKQQQQNIGLIVDSKQNKSKDLRETRLRRRANKRKEYLMELEKKGLYNPSHPTQPDPERWIPKHQRSSSRRKGGGRKGDFHRGAQGGASEKDAAKLDVAARQAALQKGELDANGRSTAHMTVSSSGATRRAGRRR